MRVKDKLISNTIYIFLEHASIAFFSFLFWIIIGKTQPPGSFGIIATAIQLFTFLSPMTMLGFGAAANKLIPELLGKGKKDKIHGLIKYTVKWIAISTILLASFLILFSSRLSFYFNFDYQVIWISAILIIIGSLGFLFKNIYYGFQNMKKTFLTNLFGEITKIALMLLLIFLGFNYFGPLIAFTFGYLVILLTRFDKKLFHISKKVKVDKALIFKYSIPFLIFAIFSALFNETQYIILTILDDVEAAGLFAVAMKISFIIPIIPGVLASALFPITSFLSSDKNRKQKQTYLIRLVFRYSLFLVLPIAIFLILFSEYAILLFSTKEYLEATQILPLITIALVSAGLSRIFYSSIYAIGKPKLHRNVRIISTLIYIFLAIPLTIYLSSLGLAISYLISTIILFFLSLVYIKKFLDIKLPFKDMARIILAILIPSIFLLLVKPYVKDFFVAGVFVLLAGFIYILFLLKLNFYLEEDLKILDFFAVRSPFFKNEIIKMRKYLSHFVHRSYKKD